MCMTTSTRDFCVRRGTLCKWNINVRNFYMFILRILVSLWMPRFQEKSLVIVNCLVNYSSVVKKSILCTNWFACRAILGQLFYDRALTTRLREHRRAVLKLQDTQTNLSIIWTFWPRHYSWQGSWLSQETFPGSLAFKERPECGEWTYRNSWHLCFASIMFLASRRNHFCT